MYLVKRTVAGCVAGISTGIAFIALFCWQETIYTPRVHPELPCWAWGLSSLAAFVVMFGSVIWDRRVRDWHRARKNGPTPD